MGAMEIMIFKKWDIWAFLTENQWINVTIYTVNEDKISVFQFQSSVLDFSKSNWSQSEVAVYDACSESTL